MGEKEKDGLVKCLLCRHKDLCLALRSGALWCMFAISVLRTQRQMDARGSLAS